MKTAGSRFLNKSDLQLFFLGLSAFVASNPPLPRRKQGYPSLYPPCASLSPMGSPLLLSAFPGVWFGKREGLGWAWLAESRQ